MDLKKESVLPLKQVGVSLAWLIRIAIFSAIFQIQCPGSGDLEDLNNTSLTSLQCLHFHA